ncbi:MAG: DUF2271 domain-containing protein [Hyphomonadaceae bacterium]|nr:DUF2271 domain-containing protein [Hyphomonadaceae bacterium]
MRSFSLAAVFAGLAVPAAWADDLTVTFEVPRLRTAEYHAPYVAIWIERADQTSAGTLAVLYDVAAPNNAGAEWLKDLRTWWRKAGRDMTLPADGLSGATRPPGRHTMTFDGARSALRTLPPGAYTLAVEAARELGGREVVRAPFMWGAPGAAATATGASELGVVSVVVASSR